MDENAETIDKIVTQRLLSLGHTVVPEDGWLLGFAVQKAESCFKIHCNLDVIPDELRTVEVDMICGEFLLAKKQSGRLEGYEFEAAVKSISEGDVSVSYSGDSTPEQQFDTLLQRLVHPSDDVFAAYRRISW